jgi:hypothetical protein
MDVNVSDVTDDIQALIRSGQGADLVVSPIPTPALRPPAAAARES